MMTTPERAEAEFRTCLEQMRDAVDPETFHTFAVQLFESWEDYLRTVSPDHPALAFLDEHRAEQRRKERGFE